MMANGSHSGKRDLASGSLIQVLMETLPLSTDQSVHIFIYWVPLRIIQAAWTVARVCESTKSSGREEGSAPSTRVRSLLQGWGVAFPLKHRNQPRESRKMKTQRNVFQTKEQVKTPETGLKHVEMHDPPL